MMKQILASLAFAILFAAALSVAPNSAVAYPHHACHSCDSCGNCYSGCESAGCNGSLSFDFGPFNEEDLAAQEILRECDEIKARLKESFAPTEEARSSEPSTATRDIVQFLRQCL